MPADKLEIEMSVLKTQLNNLCEDLRELKESNRILLEFMHKIQGGKAWLLGLMMTAASIGAIVSSFVGFLMPPKP